MRVRMTVTAEAQSMPFTHPRSSLKELLRICCKKKKTGKRAQDERHEMEREHGSRYSYVEALNPS